MKISIITISYNSIKTISNTIKSVINQKYENIEYLAVDGGSTDGTVQVLNEYSKSIFKIVSERDSGIYDAMNKGINLATGEIVGFLNSDDFYINNNILTRVANVFMEDPLLDGCYADLLYTDKLDTSRIVRYYKSKKFVPGAFAKGWCPPHPTFFLRRSIFERFGYFNLNYSIAADVEFMMRLLEIKNIRVRYVPELWVKMRMGGVTNRNLKNLWNQNQEVLRALRSHRLPTNIILFFLFKIFRRIMEFIRAQVV
jgi:glycosyltransferase involved in cell wall biosynthesis